MQCAPRASQTSKLENCVESDRDRRIMLGDCPTSYVRLPLTNGLNNPGCIYSSNLLNSRTTRPKSENEKPLPSVFPQFVAMHLASILFQQLHHCASPKCKEMFTRGLSQLILNEEKIIWVT